MRSPRLWFGNPTNRTPRQARLAREEGEEKLVLAREWRRKVEALLRYARRDLTLTQELRSMAYVSWGKYGIGAEI